MSSISETLKNAVEILRQGGISEPRREAISLLLFALNKDRAFLIAHPEYQLTKAEQKRFAGLLQRRAAHEPFQYITGRQEFFRLDFEVTPDVLIPRPETELIVEAALEILRQRVKPEICEVGIGSGCISVSILHELQKAVGTATDISEKALQVAKRNADRHGVSKRLNLQLSDVFEVLEDKKFDLIVSNPPYVPVEELASLQAEVREFEPLIALTDRKNGLSIIEKIIFEAPQYLKPDGFLLMEIGFNQMGKVKQMFDMKVWQTIEFFPDLQGIPRMVKAKIKTLE